MATAFQRRLVLSVACLAAGAASAGVIAMRGQGLSAQSGIAGTVPTPSPAPAPTPAPDAVRISGRERLVWDQAAASVEELSSFGYIAYVDGSATSLEGVSCASDAGPDGFECSAPLPSMSAGRHLIQVAAFVDGESRREGFMSLPIEVVLEGTTASGPAVTTSLVDRSARSVSTVDGVRLEAHMLVAGLEDPTDLAVIPDGRTLIAERGGRILALRDGMLASTPALQLSDIATDNGGGLLSIAIDRQFERTGHVYALYTTASGLALARFTMAGDTLAQRAVLMEGLPAAADRPAASIRMGPDGKLYVSLDAGGDPDSVRDMGSYSGKILRLNADGTTPSDQGAATPVYRAGLERPTGLAWSADPATLWLAGEDMMARHPFDAVSMQRSALDVAAGDRLALPAGTEASDIAFYDHRAIPGLGGSLLVASGRSQGLLRLRFAEGVVTSVEWLLREEVGPIRAIAVAADGAILASTATELLRISAPEM